jgi:glycosyltransferase involved in cell wall biosynthesis
VQRLVAYIREMDIQILHAHGTSVFLAAVASFLHPGLLVIWHDHFGLQDTAHRPAWLYRLAAKRIDGVITVSAKLGAWSRDHLHQPSNRVWFVPNFVSTPPVEPLETKLPGQQGGRVVCVANLRPQKDHPTLLLAMRRTIKAMPHAHLLLVGAVDDLEYEGRIRRELAVGNLGDHVSVLGFRNDVAAVLRSCDVGVLSSSSEAMPLALIEYGMAGLAVVATRVGQCADVLDEGRAGLIVLPGHPEMLADAIVALLGSPELREEFGTRLRRRVGEMYSAGAVVTQICAIYQILLSARSPGSPRLGTAVTAANGRNAS